MLENRTLRWSTPATFNDPFDTVQRLRFIDEWIDIRDEVSEYLWAKLNHEKCEVDTGSVFGATMIVLHQAIKGKTFERKNFDDFIDDFFPEALERLRLSEDQLFNEVIGELRYAKILCMTKEFKNILMWSHYADSHKGALLGFCQADQDSPWKMAKPVDYRYTLPLAFEPDQAKELLSGEKNLAHRDFLSKIVHRAVFSKSSDWAYEKELRIFAGDGRQKSESFEDLPFGKNELEFVVFGCRASDELITNCSRLVVRNYPHVRMYQAERSRTSYSLEFKELSQKIVRSS